MTAPEPVRFAALTDVGVKRSHNQDACAANPAADAHESLVRVLLNNNDFLAIR